MIHTVQTCLCVDTFQVWSWEYWHGTTQPSCCVLPISTQVLNLLEHGRLFVCCQLAEPLSASCTCLETTLPPYHVFWEELRVPAGFYSTLYSWSGWAMKAEKNVSKNVSRSSAQMWDIPSTIMDTIWQKDSREAWRFILSCLCKT